MTDETPIPSQLNRIKSEAEKDTKSENASVAAELKDKGAEARAKRMETVRVNNPAPPLDIVETVPKRELAPVVPPMVPIEGIEDLNFERQKQAMDDALAAERAAEKAQRGKITAEYTIYVKCRNGHAPGQPAHGIYLTDEGALALVASQGSGTIAPDQWYSRYKPRPEMPHYGEIVCQVCLAYSESEVPLPITRTSTRGDFTVHPRWLWRRPKDAQRLAIEGETRAFPTGPASTRGGREEAQERARNAKLEVL